MHTVAPADEGGGGGGGGRVALPTFSNALFPSFTANQKQPESTCEGTAAALAL